MPKSKKVEPTEETTIPQLDFNSAVPTPVPELPKKIRVKKVKEEAPELPPISEMDVDKAIELIKETRDTVKEKKRELVKILRDLKEYEHFLFSKPK